MNLPMVVLNLLQLGIVVMLRFIECKHFETSGESLSCQHICECVKNAAQCSNLGITSFNIFKGENLIAADLSKNSLSYLTRETFQLNRDVQVINLAENYLVTLPAVLFKGLSELVSVNVSFNMLVYAELPQKLFYESLNLRMLSMNNQGQRQTGVPPGFLDPMSSLEELHMTGVPALNMSVSTASNLRILNLGDQWCNVSDVSTETYPFINASSKLSVLSLRYCLILKMKTGFFAGLTSLKRLDVSCNPGLSPYLIPAFEHLNSQLEVLLIDMISNSSHYTNLRGLEVFCNGFNVHDILKGTPHLLALSMKQNYFIHNGNSSIHTDVPQLRYISLDGELNRLSSLENEERSTTAFLNLGLDLFLIEKLTIFKIAQFRVRGDVYDYSICSSPDALVIENGYPWERDETAIVDCDRQCRVDVVQQIVDALKSQFVIPRELIQRLYTTTSVKELVVRSSLFTYYHIVSCSAYNYTFYFEKIDYSFSHALDNDIYTPDCFYSGPVLRQFFCRGCSLTKISYNYFHHFPALTFIDLSKNKLGNLLGTDGNTEEMFRWSTSLERLDLSENDIYKLPRDFLRFTANLTFLNLSYNAMDSWGVSLAYCRHLEQIDLSFNLLKVLSPDALSVLPPNNFYLVDLRGNHFDCQCTGESRSFFHWLISSARIGLNRVTYSEKYYCSKRNVSLSMWAVHTSDIECRNTAFHQTWGGIVGGLVVLVCVLCLIFAAYINRFSIPYKVYRLRRVLKRMNLDVTACIPLTDVDPDVEQFCLSVYLAVDELEGAWPFFVHQEIKFQSRNNVSKATGSRWENVCHDIDSADLVIVTLSDGCLTDEEASADFYYAIEKGVDRTVTITKGDLESLRKGWSWRQKLVNRLLKHTPIVQWPKGELDAEFLDYFKQVLLGRRRDSRRL